MVLKVDLLGRANEAHRGTQLVRVGGYLPRGLALCHDFLSYLYNGLFEQNHSKWLITPWVLLDTFRKGQCRAGSPFGIF